MTKPPPFTYSRVTTADEAVEVLVEHGEEAKLIAGGQSLIPLMALRFAVPSHLVDVNGLRQHAYVRDDGPDGLRIGGLTRHAELERAGLGGPWGAFADAVPRIGHHPIRTRGTFGGSIAHADPTAELPLLATTLDATIGAAGPDGRREIAASEFFTGPLSTSLAPAELVLEAAFPALPTGAVSAFEEFSERSGDFAMASVCVAAVLDPSGVFTWARVGLGAVAGRPVRSRATEEVLVGRGFDRATIVAAASAAMGESTAGGDHHATAAYRRELVAVLLERTLRRVAARRRA